MQMTNTLGMSRPSRPFYLADVFLTLFFLLYFVNVGGLLFDVDRDHTHEYFYSLIQDLNFTGLIENFVVIYSRLEIGYALIANPFASAGVSYVTFMNMWTGVIVYMVLRLNPPGMRGKLIRLIFLGSSTQLMAMLQFSATGKAFITLYLMALIVTGNNVASSFVGAIGHIQSLGMLSLGDIRKMLRMLTVRLRSLLAIAILLVAVLVFGLDSTFSIASEMLMRGSVFYSLDTGPLLLLVVSGVYMAVLLVTLRNRMLVQRLLNFVMTAPAALFIELAMRTNRFTVNIALWLLLYKGRYALQILIVGIIYNIFKILL
jgi:hypothetical protein